MKRVLIALVVIAVAYIIVRIALDRAGAALGAREWQRLTQEIAADRARTAAIRFPPPADGAAVDANAADVLWSLFDRLQSASDVKDPFFAGGPQGATLTAMLRAHVKDLDDVRAALRSTRCDWPIEI